MIGRLARLTYFRRWRVCWLGWHSWRLGRLGEFPHGYVGCVCGVRRRFKAWRS